MIKEGTSGNTSRTCLQNSAETISSVMLPAGSKNKTRAVAMERAMINTTSSKFSPARLLDMWCYQSHPEERKAHADHGECSTPVETQPFDAVEGVESSPR